MRAGTKNQFRVKYVQTWQNGDKKSKNAKLKKSKTYLTQKWFFVPALKKFNQYLENCRSFSILSEAFLVKIMIIDNLTFFPFSLVFSYKAKSF